MSGPDASSGEMHGFLFPGTELDEPLLDIILNGQSLPPDAPEQVRALAEMLAALSSPAGPGELAGKEEARSAFARAIPPAGVSPVARPARRSQSLLTVPRSTRLAAALVAAAVGLGGTAAAYAGVLPSPIQDLAHHTIHAPAARPDSHPEPEPAKPGKVNPGPGKVKPGHGQPAKPGKVNPGPGQVKPGHGQPAKPGKVKPGPGKVKPGHGQVRHGQPAKPGKVKALGGSCQDQTDGGAHREPARCR
jgi:hypothetical protein